MGDGHPAVLDGAIDDSTVMKPLPDIIDRRTSYGAFSMGLLLAATLGAAKTTTSWSCTYDKTTHLLHTCWTGTTLDTFSGYNDATITVNLPDAAKAAADDPTRY